nr:uncharacterized protein LOC128695435 [Cherax quadricarinatus]
MATAATAGTCGVLVALLSMSLLWVKWKRHRTTLASSSTTQTLVTTPSVFSTTLSNNIQGPDLGADVAWMESSVPTPPPPPFLSSPLLSSHISQQYPHKPILSSPLSLSHTLLLHSPIMSLTPLHPSVTLPSSNSSPLVPSQAQSSWPLPSPPATPTPPPPPPLPETRESKWPKFISASLSESPKHNVIDSKKIMHTSAQNSTEVSDRTTINSVIPQVSVSDAGSPEIHESLQPSTIRSISTASAILNVGKLHIPERERIPIDQNAHDTLVGYRAPCINPTHCSHCPYFTKQVSRCHYHRSCGLVRSNSLPKHHTSSVQIRQEDIPVGHPWSFTPKLMRSGSCIGEYVNGQGRESPEDVVCFPCVSSSPRTIKKTTPMTLHQHGRIGWPSSPWCPHMMHHCTSHGHFCHGNHAIICSSFS